MHPTTESRLLASVRTGNTTAYHAFVTGHLGMVYDLAKRIAKGDEGDLFEELSAEGEVVVCEEALAFAGGKHEYCFSTYVHTRICRALVSYRRRQSLVPGTEWRARRAQQARPQREQLTQRLRGRPSTDDLEYVYGAGADPQEDRFLDISRLPLAQEPEDASPADREWTRRAEEGYSRLDRADRELLGIALELSEKTGNVSQTHLSHKCHVSRDEVVRVLYDFARPQ